MEVAVVVTWVSQPSPLATLSTLISQLRSASTVHGVVRVGWLTGLWAVCSGLALSVMGLSWRARGRHAGSHAEGAVFGSVLLT